MYTLINGSPKSKLSNSETFLNIIGENIKEFVLYELKKDKIDSIIESIKLSDTIVLAFPLYADSPTSITLKLLDYIYDNNINIEGKNMYFMINCGFREGEQNITALDIVKNFCNKVNSRYMGGLLIGAGEIVGNKKFKIISKTATKKIIEFSNYIKNKDVCEDMITTIDFLGNRLYSMIANYSWNKTAKKHGLTKLDIRKK